MKRIDIEDLDYSDSHLYCYRGEEFTGIAEERTASGRLVCEVSYRDGVERGPMKGWHANGQLSLEYHYGELGEISTFKEWYEDGSPKLDKTVQHGKALKVRRWSPQGALIEDRSE